MQKITLITDEKLSAAFSKKLGLSVVVGMYGPQPEIESLIKKLASSCPKTLGWSEQLKKRSPERRLQNIKNIIDIVIEGLSENHFKLVSAFNSTSRGRDQYNGIQLGQYAIANTAINYTEKAFGPFDLSLISDGYFEAATSFPFRKDKMRAKSNIDPELTMKLNELAEISGSSFTAMNENEAKPEGQEKYWVMACDIIAGLLEWVVNSELPSKQSSQLSEIRRHAVDYFIDRLNSELGLNLTLKDPRTSLYQYQIKGEHFDSVRMWEDIPPFQCILD